MPQREHSATEKLVNREQPSEIQPLPSGRSYTSSSQVHSCKQTITQAVTSEADMENRVGRNAKFDSDHCI